MRNLVAGMGNTCGNADVDRLKIGDGLAQNAHSSREVSTTISPNCVFGAAAAGA